MELLLLLLMVLLLLQLMVLLLPVLLLMPWEARLARRQPYHVLKQPLCRLDWQKLQLRLR